MEQWNATCRASYDACDPWRGATDQQDIEGGMANIDPINASKLMSLYEDLKSGTESVTLGEDPEMTKLAESCGFIVDGSSCKMPAGEIQAQWLADHEKEKNAARSQYHQEARERRSQVWTDMLQEAQPHVDVALTTEHGIQAVTLTLNQFQSYSQLYQNCHPSPITLTARPCPSR